MDCLLMLINVSVCIMMYFRVIMRVLRNKLWKGWYINCVWWCMSVSLFCVFLLCFVCVCMYVWFCCDCGGYVVKLCVWGGGGGGGMLIDFVDFMLFGFGLGLGCVVVL